MSAQRAPKIIAFYGGPLDGLTEILVATPEVLAFSSAKMGADWDTGPVRVEDVTYRRGDLGGAVVDYRWEPPCR